MTRVTTLIRYARLLALVVATLVVVMVCGEVLCDSCAHACMSRVDRADRFRRTVARILAQFASVITAGWSAIVASLAPITRPHLTWRPPTMDTLATLRI